jgi:hypothetical protein
MTATTKPAGPVSTSGPERDLGRFAGVAFAVTFFTAFTVWTLKMTIYGSDLDSFAADSVDGTTRTLGLLLSHLLMPLASVFLLWTVARLRKALDLAAGGSSVAGQVAFGAATVLVVGFCLMAAAQNVSGLVAGGDYIDGFPADPAVGYGVALLGGNFGNATVWGASVLMVVVGAASWRQSLIPRWLIWVGYVTAPLLVAGWYYGLPVLLLCLWVAVAGLKVQTDRRGAPQAGA